MNVDHVKKKLFKKKEEEDDDYSKWFGLTENGSTFLYLKGRENRYYSQSFKTDQNMSWTIKIIILE